MIIIINGSLGVGKTSVGEHLQRKFVRAVHLDGDAIGDVHPFDIYDESRIDQLYQALRLLVGYYQDNGYTSFVINYVFESPASLENLLARLRPLDPFIHTYWLTCTAQEQARRIRQRGRGELDWELQRFVELQQIQRKAAQQGFIGIEVDSSSLSPAETAEKIWKDINP
jgi:chloramphenicol 3-O-phosphotransferase